MTGLQMTLEKDESVIKRIELSRRSSLPSTFSAVRLLSGPVTSLNEAVRMVRILTESLDLTVVTAAPAYTLRVNVSSDLMPVTSEMTATSSLPARRGSTLLLTADEGEMMWVNLNCFWAASRMGATDSASWDLSDSLFAYRTFETPGSLLTAETT